MKKIYNIPAYIYYRNEQLLKDCCLIPYIYAQSYHYTPVIVTTRHEEYTYLNQLPGLVVDYQPDVTTIPEWQTRCCEYIKEHYKEMDILFCFGAYGVYTALVPLYKSLRPDGKVILKLDANSNWIDNLPFDTTEYRNLLSNCDIIICETKRIKKLLSEKLPYKFEYIPNGISPYSNFIKTDYSQKENTILTVARIGHHQKRNEDMLEAFAKISDCIPDWTLKLVGGIEDSFHSYISEYFRKYPHLKNRVIFTGKIIEKDKLYMEYAKAKIFLLSSQLEGGCPNVFAEAAIHGCYMICSDIDASGDLTNWGKNGSVYPIGDIDKLSATLAYVCDSSFDNTLKENFDSIQEYINQYFDYQKAIEKIHYLLEV